MVEMGNSVSSTSSTSFRSVASVVYFGAEKNINISSPHDEYFYSLLGHQMATGQYNSKHCMAVLFSDTIGLNFVTCEQRLIASFSQIDKVSQSGIPS